MLQIGIQPEGERKNDTGESVFPETDPISLFSGLLIHFLFYIGVNTDLRVVSRLDPCHNQVLHIKCQQASWPEDDVKPIRPLYNFI